MVTSAMQADATDNDAAMWPFRFAAVVGVLFGMLLLLMGNGHMTAVIAVAADQGRSLDWPLVAHLGTSGYLMFPALYSLVVARWLWLGRDWAYGTTIFNVTILLIYLVLLLTMEPEDPDMVGSELNIATLAVGLYLAVLAAVWAGSRWAGSRFRPGK